MTRFGIESNSIDLEQRLRGIENALDRKKDANPRGNAFSSWAAGTPQVTGISVNEAMNAWRIEWTPTEITGLQKYEVQVSSDPRFSAATSSYTRYTWYTKTDNTSTGTRYARVRALSTSQGTGPWSATIDTTTGLVTTDDITSNAVQQFIEWSETDASSFKHIYAGNAGIPHGVLGDPTPAATTETYGPVTITTSENGIVVPYTIFQMAYQCVYMSAAAFDFGFDAGSGPNLAWYPSNELKIEVLRQESGAPAPVVIDTMIFDWFNAITPGNLRLNHSVADTPRSWPAGTTRGYTTMDGQLDSQLLPDQPGAGTFSYSIRATVTSEDGVEQEGYGDDYNGKAFLYFRPYYVKIRLFEYKSVGEQ